MIKQIGIIILVSSLFNALNAQNSWENVDSVGLTYIYEQRLYRNPKEAISNPVEGRTYIPQVGGIPIGRYQFKQNKWFVSELNDPQKWSSKVRTGKTHRLDFSILPTFSAQFGNFLQPVESKTAILLQTHILLAKGLQFQGSLAFPFQNSLDRQPNELRFGPSFFSYFNRIGIKNFVMVSTGYFFTDQYGINFQYRNWSPTRLLNWGFEFSKTGQYFFYQDGQYHGKLDQSVGLGYLSFRIPKQNVTLQVIGGQFMYNDLGIRTEFIRQFTRVDVGLWISSTQNGSTLGFNFAIPLFPSSIKKPYILLGKGKLAPRLRMSEEFRWEYTYSRGVQIAERYRLAPRLDERLRMYEKGYW